MKCFNDKVFLVDYFLFVPGLLIYFVNKITKKNVKMQARKKS